MGHTNFDTIKEVGLELNRGNIVYVSVSSQKCRAKSRHKDR
jgi:hypothetical protein